MSDAGKVIVVTGSTRGIGLGLAREFLRRGHGLAICGRTQQAVDKAVAELRPDAGLGGARVLGVVCDVADTAQVQYLWDKSTATFGKVDMWINNAGQSNARLPVGRLRQEDVTALPAANIMGTYNGSRTALAGMQAQGFGAIYNFEGFGSNGATRFGLSLYGMTKCAVTQFTKSMIEETKGGPVIVGYLSPGIVLTDLSLRDKGKAPPEQWANVVHTFNILADRAETVTPWLVEQALANTTHGARIAWLTGRKAAWRMLRAKFVKEERFPELRT